MNQISIIVLAAGSGARFGDHKQFLELAPGVRLVDVALATALEVSLSTVLVLPAGRSWDGETVTTVVGGASRVSSVAAGLAAVPAGTEIVVIHDAAHPLASIDLFREVIAEVAGGADGAVPILPVTDVVKATSESGLLITTGRDGLGLAQVPMAFKLEALLQAHQRGDLGHCWEDSMMVERAGGRVKATFGSSWNIHVVTADDLKIARELFRTKQAG